MLMTRNANTALRRPSRLSRMLLKDDKALASNGTETRVSPTTIDERMLFPSLEIPGHVSLESREQWQVGLTPVSILPAAALIYFDTICIAFAWARKSSRTDFLEVEVVEIFHANLINNSLHHAVDGVAKTIIDSHCQVVRQITQNVAHLIERISWTERVQRIACRKRIECIQGVRCGGS